MLISISTTFGPATDLGYVLVKNPNKTHIFDLPSVGRAVVAFSEATMDRCTAVLMLDVNAVELVRGREGSENGGALYDYVNAKPYCTSSILTVALRRVFSSALSGKCKDRPELVDTVMPLEVTIGALPSRRGPCTIHELFEPLGYTVNCQRHPLDPVRPEWGDSEFHTVQLKGNVTVQQLMTHLFILIPVFDGDKHYFVGDAEVEKLVRHAGGWINKHPLKDMIVSRYLCNRKGLANKALDALTVLEAKAEEPQTDESVTPNEDVGAESGVEADVERVTLHQQRHAAVHAILTQRGVCSVVELGCGGGAFLKRILDDDQFESIMGVEVAGTELDKARYRLKPHKQPNPNRLRLVQGSATYRDSLVSKQRFEAAVSIEVIEHVEPDKHNMFATVLLGDVRPRVAIITTPNIEYNAIYQMPDGQLRHRDHRFEWTRAQFQQWCTMQAERFGYSVEFHPVGPVDPVLGAPSQMCVFDLRTDASVTLPPIDELPCVEEHLAGRRVTARLWNGGISVNKDNARAAFETVNRFCVDPRWMIYVPPTMSPCETAPQGIDYLEFPEQAFDHFHRHGVKKVVCERKHMGSRAVVVVCKDRQVARERFGIDDPLAGSCYTRMGRRFFSDHTLERQFIEGVREAITGSGLWDELHTGWVALDCELMPWSAKARDLIRKQYASLGAAACASLPLAIAELEQAGRRGQDTNELTQFFKERLHCVERFRVAYNQYCWNADTIADYQLAPFHLLASEGAVHGDKNHVWHMETLARIARASNGLVIATPYVVVELDDADQRSQAAKWWQDMTEVGGEGMVVKPFTFITTDEHGLLQPAVKVRGREYLRIIYGPDYTMPHLLNRLRERGLRTKRRMALQEFALGVESLTRFVNKEPLGRVHEAAFAVLALETEACDPRL